MKHPAQKNVTEAVNIFLLENREWQTYYENINVILDQMLLNIWAFDIWTEGPGYFGCLAGILQLLK